MGANEDRSDSMRLTNLHPGLDLKLLWYPDRRFTADLGGWRDLIGWWWQLCASTAKAGVVSFADWRVACCTRWLAEVEVTYFAQVKCIPPRAAKEAKNYLTSCIEQTGVHRANRRYSWCCWKWQDGASMLLFTQRVKSYHCLLQRLRRLLIVALFTYSMLKGKEQSCWETHLWCLEERYFRISVVIPKLYKDLQEWSSTICLISQSTFPAILSICVFTSFFEEWRIRQGCSSVKVGNM